LLCNVRGYLIFKHIY